MITLTAVSPLEKLWHDSIPAQLAERLSCFENEIADVQLAVMNDGAPKEDCRLRIETDLPVEVRRVGYVPGDYTDMPDADDYVIAKGLHVFPDPLLPTNTAALPLKGTSLNVFWLTVGTGERMAAGEHVVRIVLTDKNGDLLGETQVTVEVLKGQLPACDIPVTDWMHYDCICNYYKIKPFGKRFWTLTESFLRTAAEHGINTVYVPLFTPPLDTKPGGERTSVQLVDVVKNGNTYSFNFRGWGVFSKWRKSAECGILSFPICLRSGARSFVRRLSRRRKTVLSAFSVGIRAQTGKRIAHFWNASCRRSANFYGTGDTGTDRSFISPTSRTIIG